MKTAQEMFNQLQALKGERKELSSVYRDALANSAEYKKLTEEIKVLRDKRKMVTQAIDGDLRSELDRLDDLKDEMTNDKALLADAVINQLTKGETITVIDENQEKYEPVISVVFRKEGSN
jgi:replication-associated recombination protein RarA